MGGQEANHVRLAAAGRQVSAITATSPPDHWQPPRQAQQTHGRPSRQPHSGTSPKLPATRPPSSLHLPLTPAAPSRCISHRQPHGAAQACTAQGGQLPTRPPTHPPAHPPGRPPDDVCDAPLWHWAIRGLLPCTIATSSSSSISHHLKPGQHQPCATGASTRTPCSHLAPKPHRRLASSAGRQQQGPQPGSAGTQAAQAGGRAGVRAGGRAAQAGRQRRQAGRQRSSQAGSTHLAVCRRLPLCGARASAARPAHRWAPSQQAGRLGVLPGVQGRHGAGKDCMSGRPVLGLGGVAPSATDLCGALALNETSCRSGGKCTGRRQGRTRPKGGGCGVTSPCGWGSLGTRSPQSQAGCSLEGGMGGGGERMHAGAGVSAWRRQGSPAHKAALWSDGQEWRKEGQAPKPQTLENGLDPNATGRTAQPNMLAPWT